MNAIEISDSKEIEELLTRIQICHVGMVDGNVPYVLPFNYGYKDKCIYLHGGEGGRKYDVLKTNNNVCISFDIDGQLFMRNENVACSYSMNFRSVIINGQLEFIENYEEKIEGLNIIMHHYINKTFSYNMPAVNNVVVMKVKIKSISARKRGY